MLTLEMSSSEGKGKQRKFEEKVLIFHGFKFDKVIYDCHCMLIRQSNMGITTSEMSSPEMARRNSKNLKCSFQSFKDSI